MPSCVAARSSDIRPSTPRAPVRWTPASQGDFISAAIKNGALSDESTTSASVFCTSLGTGWASEPFALWELANRCAPKSFSDHAGGGAPSRQGSIVSDRRAGKLTILVVEDEPLARLTIAEFLKSFDCEVVEAATGEAAVAALRNSNEIDAVFTDIQLAGTLSGWDVAEVSRAISPDIPVVYTSGAVVPAERGVAGSVFLEKPYDPAAVLAACQTLHESR